MRIALFVTCVNDTLSPDVGVSTVRLFERLGHQVEFPEAQTCCGQLHLNAGYRRQARELAERFVRVFSYADLVVAPSASCVAAIREHYVHLAVEANADALLREVEALAPRVFELTEFLVTHGGGTELGASFPWRVAYHPTCHSLRALRLADGPVRLLQEVRGLELVDLPHDDACCGFGGTFALTNADTSIAILDDKVQAILQSGAEVVTAVDTSCLLHIGGALSQRRTGVRPLHIAEILAGDRA